MRRYSSELDGGEQVDDRAQGGTGDGLDQVGVPAGLPARGVVLEVALRGDEDDRHLLVHVTNGPAHRVAVHVGEVDVEEDEVERPLLIRRLETVRPRPGFEHLELVRLLRLENGPNQRPSGNVIVDNQDALGHGSSSR
jgi:hypothetical protein